MYNIIYDITVTFNRLYISIKISNYSLYDLYLYLSDTSDVSLKSKYRS